jgi:hypothetical protein
MQELSAAQSLDLRIQAQVRTIQQSFYALGCLLRQAYDSHIWESLPGVASWNDYLAQLGLSKSKVNYLMALPQVVLPALVAAGLSPEAAIEEITSVDETKYGILVPQMRDSSPEDVLEMVRYAQQASWNDLRQTYAPQPLVEEDPPWTLRRRPLGEEQVEIRAVLPRALYDRIVSRFHPIVVDE